MKKLVLVLLTFFTLQAVQAEVLIEPVAGYSLAFRGDMKEGERYKGNGTSYGGRFGFQKFGFQLGVDYLHSTIDVNDDDFDSNVAVDDWAAFAGFEFPILLRIYGGYIFSSSGKADYNEDGGTTKKLELLKGQGGKIGIGFTPLPLLDINFEYRAGEWKNFKLDGEDQDKDMNFSAYMVSISLPLTL